MNSIKHFLLTLAILISLGTQIASGQQHSEKPVFVLVHGAWHGGWCWQSVSENLREKDFTVYTPTLSGLGEHKNILNEKINLQTHIQDIVNLIEMEDLNNVVLVGHSYAGAVIAGVADMIPTRLKKLVFLDAMLVHNGESPHSLQPKDVQQIENKLIEGKQNLPPFPVSLFGITDSLQVRWVSERLTPQPFNTFAQKLILKHKYGNGLPLAYIACTNPWIPILKKMSKEAQNNPLWTYYTLNTGHDAMITVPNELATMFESIASDR